jgi:hypothetical protein
MFAAACKQRSSTSTKGLHSLSYFYKLLVADICRMTYNSNSQHEGNPPGTVSYLSEFVLVNCSLDKHTDCLFSDRLDTSPLSFRIREPDEKITFIVVHLVLRLKYRAEGFVREFNTDLKNGRGGGPVFVGWQVLARTAARSRARRTRRTVFPPLNARATAH